MPIDFIADEEDQDESEIDFIPDAPVAVAEPPRSVIPPPALLADAQSRAEKQADLFAQQQEARRQGEYWEGVANRAENLTRNVVEPLTRPVSGALGRALDVPLNLIRGQAPSTPEQPGTIERTLAAPIVNLPRAREAETTGGKIAAGTYNAVADLVAGFSSPDMLALLPAGGNKTVLTTWLSQMAGHAPERVLRANQLLKEGKTQEAVQEIGTGVAELGMAGMGARHMVREPGAITARDLGPESVDPRFAQDVALQLTNPRNAQRNIRMPESIRELSKEPSTIGVPNALQERRTEAPNGRLPEQPVENAQLPAQEGGGEVPPSRVPPRNEIRPPSAEETGSGALPLELARGTSSTGTSGRALPKEQLPGVQNQPAPGPEVLQEVSRRVDEALENIKSAEARGATKNELSQLRARLSEARKTEEAALRGLRQSEQPNAPPGLQPTAESGLGVSPVSSKATPSALTEASSPLPERFRDKPIAEIADAVKDVTSDEITGYQGNLTGGATGFMWDIGARAKTPADVAALRKIGEEASAKTKELMAAGDLEGAMKVIGRQPAEAYEFATGVKLDGTPKWDTLEKLAANKGKTYTPPVPDLQYLKAKGLEPSKATESAKLEPSAMAAATPEALPADLPSLARLRITKPELREQIDAKIAELQTAAAPAAAALKQLPPVPAGHVRLFHGEGGPQGGGTGGAFYTSNITKASTFGPDISWVDVPTDRATAAFAKAKGSAFAGGDNFILEPTDISRSQKIGQKVEPPTHVLDEPVAPKGIAASVRGPGGLKGSETGAISLAPLQSLVRSTAPPVKAAVEAVTDIAKGAKETGKEALGTERMTDYRRSVLNWSAKLQKSFGEAAATQKDIQTKVPKEVRREGITNWIQADGDAAVLKQRAASTNDPKLKAGYEAALNLTPEEIAVADQVRGIYERMGQRGQAADVLNNFKDNYVTQIWDLGKTKAPAGGSSRTLKERFKFSKASTFPTFFDGEQAGYVPKTKDISKLLPVYTHEMNSVIAARELVAQMSKGRASDGRRLVAPRGGGVPVEGEQGGATLVLPKKIKGDTADYKVLANQPALQGWRWASKDSSGNPIFLKGDLALHPEAYNRLKNVLGRSAIREWYTTPTTKVAAIPKAIVRGIDFANSETKRTMLGLLAPFHQVQTGTHAIGHRVNPFGGIPKVDLTGNQTQMDAAKHGLMLLPDRASEGQFMEGFKTSGLVSKIPGIGPLSDMYANYLFKQYIPGLKFKTYEAILKRNNEVYAKDLAARKLKPEDIKVLSAEQANAAYGHLNYADLARNPTVQHMAQIGLLAPDFLEARGRFAGQAIKGATGAKVGREQLVALATLAIAQAAAAFVTAKLSGGDWDKEHPFEFHVGSRKYTMRSVPEDISGLISNTRSFVHSRLSPLVGKGALQYASGVDYAGRKVTAGQTTKELLTQPIPMTLRSLPGVRSLSGQDRPGAIKAWEQLAGAVGLKISRYNTRTKLNELHADWMKNNPDPKVKADYEQQQTATFPVSKYKTLDSALADRDEDGAIKALAELKAEGQKNKDILRRMRPYVGEGINSRTKPLFHESHKLEAAFRNSLTAEQRTEYRKAIEERAATWREFLKAWRKRGTTTAAPKIDFVPDTP